MKRTLLLSHILIILSFALTDLFAQELQSPYSYTDGRYTEHFTQHHELVSYFQHVANASERVHLIEYGRSNQNRPLLLAFVSSEQNLKNLEAIRQNHLKRAGLETGEADPDLDRVIIWLSFGVHGNEAGASESSMKVLFELANSDAGKLDNWLEEAIVIIDPCLNPDGYNRYVQWYMNNSGQRINPNGEAFEHDEPWPGGRVNHYLFDLNRDWAWATQVETQSRLLLYQKWLPHVHADYHEQYPNSPYYFAPAAEPFHLYISDWQREFQEVLGKNNAKYFDEKHWMYFTREYFDLFYPSYGDTYPTFNGAIGMTYEQAGHSIAGRAYLLENGDTLNINDRIDHHYTTALSTIEVSVQLKDQLIKGFRVFYDRSRKNEFSEFRAYAIKIPPGNRGRWEKLSLLLDRHGISYAVLDSDLQTSGFSYLKMKEQSVVLDSGDIIIPGDQNKSLLLHVLFEPESGLSDSLTYDITAWALPYAHGLDAYAMNTVPPYRKAKTHKPISFVIPEKLPYAYIIEKNDISSIKGVSRLMSKGVTIRISHMPLQIEGRKFGPGAFVITRSDNVGDPLFDKHILDVTNDLFLDLDWVYTGMGDVPPDLGSDKVQMIDPVNILIPFGEQVNPNDVGQLWQFLDSEVSFPFTMVSIDKLYSIDLDKYNCIILPAGYYGSLRNKDFVDKVKDWMNNGGKLIAVGSAIEIFEGDDGLGFDTWTSESAEDDYKSSMANYQKDHRLDPYNTRIRDGLKDHVPGAIVRLELDTTHPLAFGLGSHYFALRTSGRTYEHLINAINVGFSREEVQYAGFIGSRARKKMNAASGIFVIPHGAGKFVALVDNPLYRGFWEQGKLLLSNAILLE